MNVLREQILIILLSYTATEYKSYLSLRYYIFTLINNNSTINTAFVFRKCVRSCYRCIIFKL